MGLAARSVDKLKAVAAEVEARGSKAVVCRCGVMKNEDIVAALRVTVKALGPIDILVNNAGVVSFEPVHRLPDEVWQRTIQVNLTAPFVAIRKVLPSMRARKRGRIINVASVSRKIGLPFRSAYAASNHGVLGPTKSLAAEVAPLALSLALDDSAGMTGQSSNTDGSFITH